MTEELENDEGNEKIVLFGTFGLIGCAILGVGLILLSIILGMLTYDAVDKSEIIELFMFINLISALRATNLRNFPLNTYPCSETPPLERGGVLKR